MNSTETDLEPCPSKLTDAQIEQYKEEGYIAFTDVLQSSEVEKSKQELEGIGYQLMTGNPDDVVYSPATANAENNPLSGASYKFKHNRCFMQLEPGFDPQELKDPDKIEQSIRKYMWTTEQSDFFKHLLDPSGAIIRTVESLIGPNPIHFQDMALIKPAFVGTEKPWHQDDAYFSVSPLDAVIGVWIALDDAEVENGCMHVIAQGHKNGALRHIHDRECEIMPDRIDPSKIVPVPIPAGGAMFFSGMIPHETPPNKSPFRRRALQFHFRAATSKIVDQETYNRMFVEADGSPASCRAGGLK